METPFILTYDSGHVLPFIADTLFVSARDGTVGYIGANKVLQRMLADTVDALGFERPLAVAPFDDMTAIERVTDSADILIIDLGVDVSESETFLHDLSRRELGTIPPGLVDALPVLYRLFDLERARYERVKHPRPVVLVNSSAVFWEASVLAQFDCSYATVHSRVRRATVKAGSQTRTPRRVERQYERALRLMRWSRPSPGRIGVPTGPRWRACRAVRPRASTTDSEPAGRRPRQEGSGRSDRGPSCGLASMHLDEGEYALSLLIGMVCVDSASPLNVELLVNGERVAARNFTDSAVGGLWRVALPSHVAGSGTAELTFLVDEPRSPQALGWSTDDRALGIHIRTLSRRGARPLRASGGDAGLVRSIGSRARTR